jgi:predicted ATPase/DNA-binding SARP family transcriptional activator
VARSGIEIRLLGPTEVLDREGEQRDVRGAKVRALLALLSLNAGRVVSVDRLIAGLYGDESSAGSPNAVQQLVSKLRRNLVEIDGPAGSDVVVTRPPGYLLAIEPDEVDAIRFARLLADARSAMTAGHPDRAAAFLGDALALWRGDPLADIETQEVVAAERQRLVELHDVAIEDRIDVGLALGNHAPLVAELELRVAEAPLRERRWGQLMVARYRSGNQAGALRAYQQAREVLGEELGIEPGPDLRRLEAAVLAQDPVLDLAPAIGATAVAAAAPAAAVAAPTSPATPIPRPLTDCLGRARELEMLERLATSKRLVTLVGPGGVGKTRLATEFALRHSHAFRDGIRMVELASVRDPAGVVPAVRGALDLGASDDAHGLVSTLSQQHAVLLLDNCEHVVDTVADLVASMLEAGGKLHVVATSRQGLGVPGEQLLPVPTLDGATAAELFLERAASARPDLAVDGEARAAIDRICARVDGLPLAIELAASRVRLFDVPELAQRMDERIDLTTSGPRTAAARHRTMQAVIDWSYELLDEHERALFHAMGVFAGPVTMDAFEAVGADDVPVEDIPELVAGLVDKSLVVVDRSDGIARFGMLQTVLSSAWERAVARGSSERLRRRHLEWLLALVGDRETARRRSGRRDVVRRLARDVSELQSALSWAIDHDPESALELAGRVGWGWIASGNPDVGLTAIERALTAAPDAAADTVMWAHVWAAMIGPTAGRPREALVHGDTARRMARELDDRVAYGLACATRAFAGITAPGDRDEIRALLAEGQQTLEGHDWEHAFAVLVESTAALFLEVRDTDDLLRRSLDGCRRTGNDFGLFAGLWRQAQFALRAFDVDRADLSLREALDVAAGMPGARAGIEVTGYLAVVTAAKGNPDEAARLADQAVSSARRSGLRDPHTAISLAARSTVASFGGRDDAARIDLDHATEVFDQGGLHGLGVSTIEGFAAAMLAVGRPAQAVPYQRAAVRLACEGSATSLVRGSITRLADTLEQVGAKQHAAALRATLDAGEMPSRPDVDAVLAQLDDPALAHRAFW